jgi:hypothetical protein
MGTVGRCATGLESLGRVLHRELSLASALGLDFWSPLTGAFHISRLTDADMPFARLAVGVGHVTQCSIQGGDGLGCSHGARCSTGRIAGTMDPVGHDHIINET